MSKYYLWSAQRNSRMKYDAVVTGSGTTAFSDGSNNYAQGAYDGHTHNISPDGEKMFRYHRFGGNSSNNTGSFFTIHQSQSSIPGGFHFGNGTGSNSVVFSSFLSNTYASANSDNGLRAEWLNNNEIAILVPFVSSYGLVGNHTLTGADFPASISNGAAGGLFFILSGSGATWNVTFWSTGSASNNYNSVPDGQPLDFGEAGMMAINHRYTTTETDLVFIGPKGPSAENAGNIFKKTSGSWGHHAKFTISTDVGNTNYARENDHAVRSAAWVGENQDELVISWVDHDNSSYGFTSIFTPATGSEDKNRYKCVGKSSAALANARPHLAYDPYSKKLFSTYSNLMYVLPSSSNWYTGITGSISTINSMSEVELLLGRSGVDFASVPPATNAEMDQSLIRYKFADGYTGIVYGSNIGYGHMGFIESGSYGWLGAPLNVTSRNTLAENYMKISGSTRTDWQGSADLYLTADDSRNRHMPRIAVLNSYYGDTWGWNSTKGGSGDKLFTLEGLGTSSTQKGQTTGRVIFINFNAYDGVTPEEWSPVSSDATGSTTYQLSSSATSGIDWIHHELQNEGSASINTNYVGKGGKFSPDGTTLAIANIHSNFGTQTDGNDYVSGIDFWTSGSGGWSYLTSSVAHVGSSAGFSDIEWMSNDKLVAMSTTSTTAGSPLLFTSSSASGWAKSSVYLYSVSDIGSPEYYQYSNLTAARRVLFNDDNSAVVVWKEDGYYVTLVSSSAGSNGYVGTFDNRGWADNFVWAGKHEDGRHKLIARRDDTGAFAMGLIDPTTGKDTGGGLSGGNELSEYNSSEDTDAGNFMFWHSASNSLITTDTSGLIVEHKITPFTEHLALASSATYPSGSYYTHWMGYWEARPDDNSTVLTSKPIYYQVGHNATTAFPMSSSSGIGQFNEGTTQANDKPFSSSKVIRDPNTDDRFFVGGHDSTGSPMRLKVFERGADGWKMKTVFSFDSSLYQDSAAGRARFHLDFDLSSLGELVVPATGSDTGFQIAHVGTYSANPALDASVTSSIGTSGGTLSAGGTQETPAIQVTVPENALTGDTSLSAEVMTDATYKFNNLLDIKTQAGSAGAELVSDIFRLTPHGQNFRRAVTVQLELASAPSDLQIWKRDSHEGNYTQWYRLPDHLWSNSGTTVTINTTRFSEFAGLGGINVARTKLSNSQLVTLTTTDLVDSTSIRVSGSNTGKNLTVASGDLFILESGGATYHVSASQMAEYFGGLVSVSASSDNSDMRMTFVSPDDSTDVGLAVDAGILYNPSSNTLKGTNLSGSGTLQIAGNTDLAGTLDVVGLISGSGGLDIAGAADFGAAVNIQGALDVDGATTLDGLTVAEAADFSSTLSVTGLISGSGGIDIAGAADFGAAVNVQGALDVDGATTLDGLTVAEAADFSSTVSVTGLISGSGGIDIAGAADFGAAVNVQGALDVDGATTLDGLTVAEAAVFQSTISGSGDISGAGDLNIDGAADLRSTLAVAGNADLNGQLDVAGQVDLAASGVATSVRGTLAVSEAATFSSTISGSGDISGAGDLNIDGAADLRSTLAVAGNADLNGELDVAGATSLAASGLLTDIRGTLSVDEAATFDASVTIAGNLTVQGTTTSVDSQNTLIEDPLMVLGSSSNGVSADGDRGLILELSGSNNKAMFWDQSASEFAFVDTTSNHDATVVATTDYANLHIGALSADDASSFGGDVSVTGDVSASADVYAAGNAIVAGAVTASFFSGDGSGLTGVGAEVIAAGADSIDLQLAFTSGTAAAGSFFIDSGSITYNPGTDTFKTVNISGSGDISGAGALNIDGAADLRSTLAVAGNADLNGQLDVAGLISGSAGLDIAGVADFGGAVNVQGALDVDGATTLDGLTVAEAAAFSSTVSVTGLISGSGGIDIAGAADFGAAVNVQGALDVDGATTLDGLTVAEAADFSSTVSVTGLISGSGGIDIAGAADFGAAVNVQGALDVDGATTLDGLTVAEAADFSSTVSVTGLISGSGGIDIAGAADFGAAVNVQGLLSGSGGMDMAGAVDLGSTLGVQGAVTLSDSTGLAIDSNDSTHFMLVVDSDDSIVKRESINDFVQHITGAAGTRGGIQVHQGKLHIVQAEESFVSSSMTAGLTASIAGPVLSGSLMVFLNGLLQTRSGSANSINVFDYKVDSETAPTEIRMADSIDSDDVLIVRYIQK